MEFKRAEKVTGNGLFLERIKGQERYYFLLDSKDDVLYFEINPTLFKHAGIEGDSLKFYDFKTGKIYEPIKPQDNVIYSDAIVYFDGYIYFTQLDLNNWTLTLYQYLPGKELTKKFVRVVADLDLYNPHLVPGDDGPFIVGEDRDGDEITEIGFYPENFRAKREDSGDELTLIKDHQLYFDTMVDEYDNAGNFVNNHDEIVVKDFDGKVVHREKGTMKLLPDGTWWII